MDANRDKQNNAIQARDGTPVGPVPPGKSRLAPASCGIRSVAGVGLLADSRFESGRHQLRWDGHGGDGVPVAEEVYFARLMLDGEVSTRSIALIR